MVKFGPIELIHFRDARNLSEKNHRDLEKSRPIKKVLSLDEDELETLEALKGKTLFSSVLVIYQKLLLKQALYEGINHGKYLAEIDFVVPLDEEVMAWVRSYGYAISRKNNIVWQTGADGWQYESLNSPPPSNTEFTLLW